MILEVPFGKMPDGEADTRDLAYMPHLLIGGMTGSGKSGFLHSLVCSLAQTHSPEQVQFVLMDLKQTEFGGYAKLPHLHSPVIHEVGQGIAMLKRVEAEMKRRLALQPIGMYSSDFLKSEEYIKSQGLTLASHQHIVVVIDEFSDFMTLAKEAFESSVCQIAVAGWMAGVHLVLATSRLDARIMSDSLKEIIQGRLARLAFRVCDESDSRTLLGDCGAETLRKRGDALLKDYNGAIVRLQSPYIRDADIPQIVALAAARHQGAAERLGESAICDHKRAAVSLDVSRNTVRKYLERCPPSSPTARSTSPSSAASCRRRRKGATDDK